MNIVQALHDPKLFRPHFEPLATWSSWEVFLRASFGLSFETDEQRKLYHECTGRSDEPTSPSDRTSPSRETITPDDPVVAGWAPGAMHTTVAGSTLSIARLKARSTCPSESAAVAWLAVSADETVYFAIGGNQIIALDGRRLIGLPPGTPCVNPY